jgi:class 3 adenylate cyclase
MIERCRQVRRPDSLATARVTLAVHIAARVAGLAAPGEILVSSTVKDLLAGPGIEFESRGEHDLKGIPE